MRTIVCFRGSRCALFISLTVSSYCATPVLTFAQCVPVSPAIENYTAGSGATAPAYRSTAIGYASSATCENSVAVGSHATTTGNPGGATAVGAVSTANGLNSTSIGFFSSATATSTVALGVNAQASAEGGTAIGNGTRAGGLNSLAVGLGSTATHSNSVAIGANVSTQRQDQVIIGSGTNTYSTPGITSNESRVAQGAPTHVITSNANGDLAAYSFSELGYSSSSDLNELRGEVSSMRGDVNRAFQKIDENTQGIATAIALAGGLNLPDSHNFGVSAGWGQYDGKSAFAATSAVRLNRNVILNGAIGTGTDGQSKVGTRLGAQWTW